MDFAAGERFITRDTLAEERPRRSASAFRLIGAELEGADFFAGPRFARFIRVSFAEPGTGTAGAQAKSSAKKDNRSVPAMHAGTLG